MTYVNRAKNPLEYRVGDVVMAKIGGLKFRPWVVIQLRPVRNDPQSVVLLIVGVTSAQAPGYYLPLPHEKHKFVGTLMATMLLGPGGISPPDLSVHELGPAYVPAIRDWLRKQYIF